MPTRPIARHLQIGIERDIAASTLPAATDASAPAGLVLTIAQGLSLLARDGTSRASLLSIVEIGMRAWPRT